MAGFIAGLTGAVGDSLEKSEQRKYTEGKEERDRKRKLVELAATQAIQDASTTGAWDALPGLLKQVYGEMDELGTPEGAPKGEKSPLAKMGFNLGTLLGKRHQQQQQQAGAQQAKVDVAGAPGVTAQPGGGGILPDKGASAMPPVQGGGAPGQMTPSMPGTGFQSPWAQFGESVQRKREEGEEKVYQTGRKRVRAEGVEQTQADETKANELTKYFKSQGMDDKAAREEADLVVFKKGKAPAGHNMAQVLYKKPGSEELLTGLSDPREAGVVFDSSSGQRLEPGSFTVVDKTLASTEARGKYWGEFGNYYRAMRGRGLDDAGAKRAAGDMIAKKYGVQIGKTEQQMAIDQSLSGVGPGGGLPPSAARPQSAAQPGAGPGAVTPPLPPRRTAPPAAGGSPLTGGGLTQREQEDVLYYLGTLTGTQKGASKASQVRGQNGLRTISRVTGLDPMTLTARLTETPALAKQISETVQRSGAIQRLNNTIEKHGKILIGTTAKLRNSGSPFINKPLREWARQASGDPDYKRFIVAINEVQREYAYLTAGGAQSRAMLPVHTNESMEAILSKDSTPEEIAAAVNQISIGAQTEQQAMDKTVQDLQQKMLGGPAGQATGVTTPGAPGASRVKILGVQ